MFVVFEGLDGAGTTTHAQMLADKLRSEGKAVVLTKEPTDEGPVGKLIRQVLRHEYELSPEALQLLFVADRAEHLAKVIEPALAENKVVICDRYIWSTIAYGGLQIKDVDWLKSINATFRKPDLLLYMKQEVDECLRRIADRESTELFEKKEKLEKIAAAYDQLAKENPDIHVIDTTPSKEDVAKTVLNLYQKSAR